MGGDRSRRGESHRTLRDGSINGPAPGNKLPGYDHSVPPGQRRVSPIHRFAVKAAPLQARLSLNFFLRSLRLFAAILLSFL
jgi:hypothetical protein